MLIQTGLIAVVFTIAYQVIFRYIDRAYPPMPQVCVEREQFLRVLSVMLGYGLMMVIVTAYPLKPAPSVLWYITGITVAIIGLCLCISARMALAGNWGSRICTQPCQSLVTSGPYRHIRHPYYMGMLIINLGFGTIAKNGLVMLTAFCWYGSIVFRVEAEDKSLLERFGNRYRDYCNSVPPFFPRLRVRKFAYKRERRIMHWRIRRS